MKNILALLLFFLSLTFYGQDKPVVASYDWDENPNYNLSLKSDDPMISLKEKFIIEFAYEKKDAFNEYYVEHKALLLNSNDKIEDYNKVYLPYSSKSQLIKSKARVITKSGKIIVLDDSKILTAHYEQTGYNYKYFAFEGVELGSVIEYFYIEKKRPSYNGTIFRLQSSYLKKSVEFDLYSPSNLIFKFKTYNGLSEVKKDTLSKKKNHWTLSVASLEGLQKEEQAPYDASRGGLIYKLDRNIQSNKTDISSYGGVSQNIYNFYYPEFNKKTESQINKFIAQHTTDKQEIASKLRSLDNAIKSNFIISESNEESLKDIGTIIQKKVANETGMIKLYISLIRYLKIKHEVVITTDRSKLKFDKSFEALNFLNEFLIYFPNLKTYVSPTDLETRYGYPPANLTDNYGLFIKEVKLGDFTSAIGKIKYIEPLSAEKTIDKMVIDVAFDPLDITTNLIKLERSFTGYYGMQIHPYMNLIKGDDRDEFLESMAKRMNKDVEVLNSTILNEEPKLFGEKPLQIILDVKSDAFVEKAGNKYLFKIGDLIGKQTEMYQEKTRVLPFENKFKRGYLRNIKINIPKGYKVANLEELNIDNQFKKEDELLFSFTSFYSLKDGVLDITADEYYHKNIIDLSIFEEFRKVINTAADFNKIILILEPTNK